MSYEQPRLSDLLVVTSPRVTGVPHVCEAFWGFVCLEPFSTRYKKMSPESPGEACGGQGAAEVNMGGTSTGEDFPRLPGQNL